jgi:hypothetical protein
MTPARSARVLSIAAACLLAGAAVAAQTAAKRTATVTADAPIYIEAAVLPVPLRVAPPGTVLRVLRRGADWVEVEWDDPQWGTRVGWVQRPLLEFSSDAPVPAAVPAPEPATAANAPPPPAPQIPPPPPVTATTTVRARPKNVTIRGYVTSVNSPTEFEIEDYRIQRDEGFVLDLENADPDVRFRLEDIRVGVELEIRGVWYADTGALKASSIKVDLEQFKKSRQTAVLTRMPEQREAGPGGSSRLYFADGQRIRLTPATQVMFALTKREKELAKAQRGRKGAEPGPSDVEFRPLASLDEVSAGMLMTYEGRRDPADGCIVAERVEFQHNDLEDGEKKLWESVKAEVKPFNATSAAPGELKIDHVGKFKTLPLPDVQAYVEAIGRTAIPPHQRDLPAGDPAKIPFQFHVVVDHTANAFATPNGIVVVNSGLFDVLENEAQLSFILSHEVSHAVQEHSWRESQHLKVRRGLLKVGAAVAAVYGQYDLANMASMFEAALRNGYSRSMENQADRMGVERMVAAGYDPREAPNTWKALTKKTGDSPTSWFWSSHDNHAARRSYLMNELRNNYAGLDYASLRVGGDTFAGMAARVKEATATKRKVKVY